MYTGCLEVKDCNGLYKKCKLLRITACPPPSPADHLLPRRTSSHTTALVPRQTNNVVNIKLLVGNNYLGSAFIAVSLPPKD